MIIRTLLGSCAKWSTLGLIAVSTLQASYVNANINNGQKGVVCGSVNPIDPGEPCAGSPNVSSVTLSAQYTDAEGSYNASALTGYGLNRVYAESSANNGGVQAVSEWMVVYSLSGAPVGTPVNLLVELGYDVLVSTAGTSSAGFRMVLNGDTFSPFDIATTGNPFGGDQCFDRPGQTAIGACAGRHTGTTSRMITANVGPNNRISVSVSGGTFGTGLVDAYHTVNVLGITVPEGIGWEYQGVTGNPLNFDYAGSASPVPEPAAFQLLGAGLSALALFVRRSSAVRVR